MIPLSPRNTPLSEWPIVRSTLTCSIPQIISHLGGAFQGRLDFVLKFDRETGVAPLFPKDDAFTVQYGVTLGDSGSRSSRRGVRGGRGSMASGGISANVQRVYATDLSVRQCRIIDTITRLIEALIIMKGAQWGLSEAHVNSLLDPTSMESQLHTLYKQTVDTPKNLECFQGVTYRRVEGEETAFVTTRVPPLGTLIVTPSGKFAKVTQVNPLKTDPNGFDYKPGMAFVCFPTDQLLKAMAVSSEAMNLTIRGQKDEVVDNVKRAFACVTAPGLRARPPYLSLDPETGAVIENRTPNAVRVHPDFLVNSQGGAVELPSGGVSIVVALTLETLREQGLKFLELQETFVMQQQRSLYRIAMKGSVPPRTLKDTSAHLRTGQLWLDCLLGARHIPREGDPEASIGISSGSFANAIVIHGGRYVKLLRGMMKWQYSDQHVTVDVPKLMTAGSASARVRKIEDWRFQVGSTTVSLKGLLPEGLNYDPGTGNLYQIPKWTYFDGRFSTDIVNTRTFSCIRLG